MKKFVIGFAVVLVILLLGSWIASLVSPRPSVPPHLLSLQPGQVLHVTLIQKVDSHSSAASANQSSHNTYTAHETYLVTAIDSDGNITFKVSVLDWTGLPAYPGQPSPPPPSSWQFTVDAEGKIMTGYIWPNFLSTPLAPFADDFCVPLPKTLQTNTAYAAVINRGLDSSSVNYTLQVQVASTPKDSPALLTATSNSTAKSSSTAPNGITTTSSDSVTKSLSCSFSPSLHRPVSEHSTVLYTSTRTDSLNGQSFAPASSQINIDTTITYA